VDWKIRIPSPKRRKQWDAFWDQYLFEKRELSRFKASKSPEEIRLPLLNLHYVRRAEPATRKKKKKTPRQR
jgi:hypothetical protein